MPDLDLSHRTVSRNGLVLSLLVMLAALPCPTRANDTSPLGLRATLVADGISELASRDELGTAVATDGAVAVVGAPYHDLAGNDAGAVFVYRLDGSDWTEEARLIAADAGDADGFGTAVAVNGDIIAVGAPLAGGDGGVYVFEHDGSGWTEVDRISAPGGAPGDSFGSALVLDDHLLIVGAPRTDDGSIVDTGAAYIFERTGAVWTHRATLTPVSAVASGRFGAAVGLASGTAVVGSPRAGTAATAAGSVTVFTSSGGWADGLELVGADTTSGDEFGSSVSILGELLVVGAPGSGGTGAAYVFERSGGAWNDGARLVPATAASDDKSGRSVVLLDGVVAVGAPGAGAGGRVVLFTGSGSSWQEAAALQPVAAGSGSRFGWAIATGSSTLLVGAPGDGAMGTDAGVAWAFTGAGSSWADGARLEGAGTAAFDLFGVSVAMDGDTAVVGAPAEDVGSAAEAGAIYVYVRAAGSWIRQARLVASVPSEGAQLGTDVAISGDIIVAGAWLADDAIKDGGAVFVFERNGDAWEQAARLTPAALERNDYFGRAVAISGDTVVGTAAGGSTVFVYRRTGGSWGLEDTLYPYPKPAYPLLLASIDLADDVLVVGAQVEAAAYVFERSGSTWAETARLTSPSGQDEDFFGTTVAVNGGTVAVAAPLENVAAQLDAGAVYLFGREGASWAQRHRLQASTPFLEDAFGVGLDIDDATIAVGAPSNRTEGPRPGSIVIFGRSGGNWTPTAVLEDPTGQGGAQFGFAVATDGGAAVAGAWGTDRPPGTPDQGAAYVFEPRPVSTTAPTARIIWLPVGPAAGQAIQFVDASSGTPTTWLWDLGDGRTSTDPNPVHVFDTPGRYDVMLTVGNTFGQSIAEATVEVRNPGEPGFEPSIAVAAVARVEGVGAFFSSRLVMYNSGNDPLLMDAVYTPRVDVGGPALVSGVELEAGVQLELDDPLGAWFGLAGSETGVGSLMLRVIDGDPSSLLTYSVVFARNADGSEYGQLFPAIAGNDGVAAGGSALMATTSDAAHNRVNVGVMALAEGTRVRVTPVDPIGSPLGSSRLVELGLGGSRQFNNVHQTFGLEPSAEDFVLVADVETGRAVTFASVVDGVGGTYGGTNDPTTILPMLGDNRVTLIALGPVSGLNEFSGSASVTNLGGTSAIVDASFFARDDGMSGPAATATVTVSAGDTVGYQDLVGELFDLEGVGTVVLEAESGATIAATGREFSIQKDGGGSVIGRAGQLIRGLRDDELLQPGSVAHFLGLRQVDATPVPERTNIVAFNPGEDAVSLTLKLFDGATGLFEGERSYPISPHDLRQINLVISKINPNQNGEVKRIEAQVDGPLFVQAVRANRDGDPITIDPLPPPETR